MVKPLSRQAPSARLADVELAPLDDSVRAWPAHMVDVDGLRINVRTTPTTNAQAEPALFVHGLGGSAHNWTDFAGVLRNHLAIEAIDLPGHGRSGPGERYSIARHAEGGIRYLEVSGRGPVHLVGHSMGGAVCVGGAAK